MASGLRYEREQAYKFRSGRERSVRAVGRDGGQPSLRQRLAAAAQNLLPRDARGRFFLRETRGFLIRQVEVAGLAGLGRTVCLLEEPLIFRKSWVEPHFGENSGCAGQRIFAIRMNLQLLVL